LQQEHGRIVRKADDTQPGDTLHARISDGQLRLQVLDVRYTT
jgi:exonuclease VII large subunit